MEIPTNITINVLVTQAGSASSVDWMHILYNHWFGLVIALAALLVGCIIIGLVFWALLKRKEKCDQHHEDTCFDVIQEKACAITAAGGLAAVGVGSSGTVHLALSKAKTRGRTELAHILEIKVETLKKNFLKEKCGVDGTELNNLFASASKQIASHVLRGAVPKDLRYSTIDGISTAWALMVVDPQVIADVFDDQASKHPEMHKHLRASQAYNDLVADANEFAAYKRGKSEVTAENGNNKTNNAITAELNMRNERQAIVDLIDHILCSQPPVEIEPDTDPIRGRLANQLIKEKYLDGGVAYDRKELPAMIAILDVTIKGRRLRDELAEEICNARFSTKIKRGLVYLLSAACGFIGGILAAIVTAILLRRMGM